ncbi:NYN domain-containing protein [Peptostreptococcaceae bacterium oral taxon 081]|nr:NYN domain-containing protein [Peptostreptococcaceae bacterium oral taxon 081]
MFNEEKKIAVLIDADNVSPKYIKSLLDETSNYGTITYRRIYGDWTSQSLSGWKSVMLENSLNPVQQYSYTTGKNSTDCAMIIDAMDILYSNSVQAFCLVSSDSDFTRLVMRLREAGMLVIGMGEKKTPKPFTNACSIFKYLDVLVEYEDEQNDEEKMDIKEKSPIEDNQSPDKSYITSIDDIENIILKIILEKSDTSKYMNIGEIGNSILKRYPDFDVRNYGYYKLSTFLSNLPSIGIVKKENSVKAYIKENNEIRDIIYTILEDNESKSVDMGRLSQLLLEKIPQFDVKNYGYNKFSKFISSFDEFEIKSSGQRNCIKNVSIKVAR